MAKKHFTLFIIILTIASLLCACSKTEPEYNTKSASTTVQTQNTATQQEEQSITFSIQQYEGLWSEPNLSWKTGGFLLELSIENGILTINYHLTQAAPSFRVAEITEHVALTAIENSTITANFENDNWGNGGVISLKFLDEKILCTLSNVKYSEEDAVALWGMFDCEVELVRNDDAHQDLSYTMDEYYELFPEEEPTTEDTDSVPTIDDMKKNCIMFEWDVYDDFAYNTTLSPCRRSDLLSNPDAYINQLFAPCETLTNFVVCPDCLGSGFYHGIAEKGKCYNKGYKSIDKTENNIHYILQEYPDQATLKAISITKISTDINGTLIYEHQYEKNLIGSDYIYDLREDKSITITKDTIFVPYLVFLGKVDGVLKFGMFACDIIQQ